MDSRPTVHTLRMVIMLALVYGSEAQLVSGVNFPWDLGVEERIARRVDPEERESRLRANAVKHGRTYEPKNDGFIYDVLDGSRDPELFFTWELFESLDLLAFDERNPRIVEEGRSRIEEHAEHFGALEPEFWTDIGKIIKACKAGPKIGRGSSYTECTCNWSPALRAAQDQFGKKRFLQFLYEAVAPVTSRGFQSNTERKGLVLWYRYRGCSK